MQLKNSQHYLTKMDTNYNRLHIFLKIICSLSGIIGLFLLIPAIVGYLLDEREYISFLISAGICIVLFIFSLFLKKKRWKNIIFRTKDGFISVCFSWIAVVIFGSLPYYISGHTPLYTDAFFESMSGFTTTGSTIFADVEILPHCILLWRALTQWVGGIGIIVVFIALSSTLNLNSNNLYTAEATGLTKNKISPRIGKTAKILCIIYLLITIAAIISLKLGGMNIFDSICHTFATVATGGFSTKNASIAAYPAHIHYIITFFMLLSGINFSLYYFAAKRNFKTVFKNEELKSYLLFVLFAGLVIGITLIISTDSTVEQALKDSYFQVVSIITTTGFVSTEFNGWPPFVKFLLLLLMLTGACAGSTSGAIKISRIILLVKNSVLEFKRAAHPRAVLPLKYNDIVLRTEVVRRIISFVSLYLFILFLGSLLISIWSLDIETSISIAASSMGNVGPAFGEICSMCSFGDLDAPVKWICSFLMLTGRLELFTVLIMFMPAFWTHK